MKLVFVGAGNIARFHLQAFQLAGAEIVGTCTPGERGKIFANEHQIPHYESSLDVLIKKSCPDAICLLTQPSAYLSLLKIIRPYNIPVFMEKPISYKTSEAEELRAFLPDLVFVGLNRRFYSNIQAINVKDEKEIVGQIAIPERHKDFVNRSEKDRNHWHMMNGIHCIDVFTQLLGHPQEIICKERWGGLCGSNLPQYNICVYRTTKNHRAVFISNFDSPGGWRIHLFLKQKEIMISPLEETRIKSLKGIEALELSEDDRKAKQGFLAQAKCFLQGVRAPKQLPDTWIHFDSALKSMHSLEKIFS